MCKCCDVREDEPVWTKLNNFTIGDDIKIEVDLFINEVEQSITLTKEINDGQIWIVRKMLSTDINYCPFCGRKLKEDK